MYELNEKVKNLEPYSPISGTYRIRFGCERILVLTRRQIFARRWPNNWRPQRSIGTRIRLRGRFARRLPPIIGI